MVSLTALVLTITMVVVQLAMGQFSPRIVQRILQDKPSQLAIGLFVATFVHAILALREVTNNGDSTGNVPGIAVLTAFVLVLVSIAVLVIYVHHIGQSLRVSSLIELVGKDTRKLHRSQVPGRRPCRRARARRTGGRVRPTLGCRHRDRLRRSRRGGAARLRATGARSRARRVRAGGRAALSRARDDGRPGRGPTAQVADPDAGADPRGGRRLRRPAARRHRGAVALRLAVPGSDDGSAGARPPARRAAPARPAAVPGRAPPRRRGEGEARRALDELGGVRPSRLRRDPDGRRRIAAGRRDA